MTTTDHRHPSVQRRQALAAADARERAAQALAETRARHGDGHPRVADALRALAALCRSGGDAAAAEPLLQEALAIRDAHAETDPQACIEALRDLAHLLDLTMRPAEARPLLRRAARMESAAFQPASPTPSVPAQDKADDARAEFIETMAGSAPKSFWTQTLGGIVIPLALAIGPMIIMVTGRFRYYGGAGGVRWVRPLLVEGAAARGMALAGIGVALFLHFHYFWPYRHRVLCAYGKTAAFVLTMTALFTGLTLLQKSL